VGVCNAIGNDNYGLITGSFCNFEHFGKFAILIGCCLSSYALMVCAACYLVKAAKIYFIDDGAILFSFYYGSIKAGIVTQLRCYPNPVEIPVAVEGCLD
jgi:hypothetical protein